jgi:hypothetical protein
VFLALAVEVSCAFLALAIEPARGNQRPTMPKQKPRAGTQRSLHAVEVSDSPVMHSARETRQSLTGSLHRLLVGTGVERCPALPARQASRQICGVLQELREGLRLCRLCRGGAPGPRATTTNYTPAATALPSLEPKAKPWCPQARLGCRRGRESRIKSRAALGASPIFPEG